MLSNAYRSLSVKNKTLYPHSIYWIRFCHFITMLGILQYWCAGRSFFTEAPFSFLHGSPLSIALAVFFIILLAYGTSNPVILYGLSYFVKNSSRTCHCNCYQYYAGTGNSDSRCCIAQGTIWKGKNGSFWTGDQTIHGRTGPLLWSGVQFDSMSKALNIPVTIFPGSSVTRSGNHLLTIARISGWSM